MTVRSSRPATPRAPIAPIHRGPQAITASTQYSPPVHHAPNAALLIDFDNVTMGIRSDLAGELRNLLSSDIIKGKVAVQRAYADWRRYPQYIVPLAESSIDMIMAPAYGSSKKNATDIRLAVDAMELVFTRSEIGTYILLSGDSDFASLVTKLKEYGKYVIGVGIRESSSDLLVMNCDEYYSYNALAGLVKQSEEDVQKWDPWELVVEAIGRMKKNGDVMRSDRLKQVMQDIDAAFDEKNYGYSKFSKFVSDASEKGLVTITKLENGQLEVSPAARGTRTPAVAAGEPARRPEAGADDDEARDERGGREDRSGRRGRRGGRGRGRERGDRIGMVPADGAADVADAPLSTPETTEPAGTAEPTIAAAAPAAPRPSHRGERPGRPERTERSEARVEAPRPEARPEPRAEAPRDDIGSSGERLTRQEAFDIVKRATEALVSGDGSASARAVRTKAFALLGRDSESLSERNFDRILRDAHDQEVIDLRRRGNDFEVSLPAAVPPVAEQLNRAAAAHTASLPVAAAPPPTPRGMGPRTAPPRGGRPSGRGPGGPPPDLLMVGVVEEAPPSRVSPPAAPAPTPAPAQAAASQPEPVAAQPAEPAAAPTAAPAPAKKGRGAKTPAKRAAKSPATPAPPAPAAKRAAPAKTAAKGAAAKEAKGRGGAAGAPAGRGGRAKKPAAT